MGLTVLVIGNGFDLNLGLPTGYKDFMKSGNFQQLIESKNDLAIYLKEKAMLQDWIDVEIELKNYSKFLYGKENIFQRDFIMLSKALMNYLDKEDKSLLDIDLMETSSFAYPLLQDVCKSERFQIFDFNYTRTTKRLLKMFNIPDNKINGSLIKVHGSLGEKNIVFGVEDNADIETEHIFLKKAYHPCFKAPDISSCMKEAKKIIIFGHSLGETDHTYFNDFFNYAHSNISQKDIVLYHYGEQSRLRLFEQLDVLTVKNLTKLRSNNTFKLMNTQDC